MKLTIYIFFIFFTLASCTSRTIYKKPENLISKDKMINIWTDLYISMGAKSIKTKKLEKDKNYIPLVLEKFKIDSIQFSKSNIYYTSRIEEYEEMFEEVQKRLNDLKNIYDPETEIDSLIRLSEQEILE
ncbi:MAG: DUF4296 domain-containing protein [Aureibaculum sp.]|nr:DUF4296 domain-containing protein [Aureibaculum sp.]